MTRSLATFIAPIFVVTSITFLVGGALAQQSTPAPTPASPPAIEEDTAAQQSSRGSEGLSPAELPGGKTGLVRGVVKQMDPVHDQLVIHAFGGGDVRIAFDPRTHLLPENTKMHLTSIPTGSVVSVDTVIDNGKLFARSIRTGSSGPATVELNGKVVRYDSAKSRLILRDPLSPQNVSLRVSPTTTVVRQGRAESVQSLASGMLVRVLLSAAPETANNIEILARPGDAFTFEGRILSVDLRSNIVALSNSTDQSIRELAIGGLDANALGLLRNGADVNIQAEFDGDRYNARTVTLVPPAQ